MNASYNLHHLSIEEKINLLKDAKEISFRWNVDILDCTKSFSRQSISMSFEDILKKAKVGCHFTFIERSLPYFLTEDLFYTEIGFCEMNANKPDHFLFIFVKQEDAKKLIDKYKLTV